MIAGGNATIIVQDMDRSIRFYTEVLGLKLTNRFGNDWATVSAGEGLTIGIHPASAKYPAPGTRGAILLGLDIDIPIDQALSRLARHNVKIRGAAVSSPEGNFAHLEDPDGNELYLWEKLPHTTPLNARTPRNRLRLTEHSIDTSTHLAERTSTAIGGPYRGCERAEGASGSIIGRWLSSSGS